MKFIKNNLANAFTLGNLLSGSIGAIHLVYGDYQITAICIIISLILDFFDGFVARALGANSALGVQLDSLADMVSFGLIPGLAMYKMLEPYNAELLGFHLPFQIKYLGLFITLFSCLRLAIFNIDEEQRYYFKGLNTPSNTILVFGLYYTYQTLGSYAILAEHPMALLATTALLSWLLVSPIKMIAMKFKSKKIKDNYPTIALVLGSVLILATMHTTGIPLVILYYITVSIISLRSTP